MFNEKLSRSTSMALPDLTIIPQSDRMKRLEEIVAASTRVAIAQNCVGVRIEELRTYLGELGGSVIAEGYDVDITGRYVPWRANVEIDEIEEGEFVVTRFIKWG